MKDGASVMRTIHGPWKLLGMVGCLGGCTTLVSHTTIEPYTKDKQQRNALESLAENYCSNKRTLPGNGHPPRLPDYIYTTDGCSSWPDGSWQVCCVVHDIPYWCGGSEEDRKQTDEWLEQCANEKATGMGDIMYPAVRIGGAPWLPAPWRWGYGWDNWPQGYETIERSPSVKDLLERLKVRSIVEDHFMEIQKSPANPQH